MVPTEDLFKKYLVQIKSTKRLMKRINQLNKSYTEMDDTHLIVVLTELISRTRDEVLGWLGIENLCFIKGYLEDGVWPESVQRLSQRAHQEAAALDELRDQLTEALDSVKKDDFFYDPKKRS